MIPVTRWVWPGQLCADSNVTVGQIDLDAEVARPLLCGYSMQSQSAEILTHLVMLMQADKIRALAGCKCLEQTVEGTC